MPTPTVVFLDTSILAGQQYNFSSTAFATFVPAAQKAALRLLLPDPTEREIRRQIRERSKEALDALELARKRAPFLAKWNSFPQGSPSLDNWSVTRVATGEWHNFLSQFNVERLGYDMLNIKEVMDWYDLIHAPFREGKKRKDFPDAFAISMIDAYAEKHATFVAVVSEDGDFKLACERFPNLLYFKTLPRLTEHLLAGQENVETIHAAIEQDFAKLQNAVNREVDALTFVHYDRHFDVGASKVDHVWIDDLSVVAIGESECTVTFEVRCDVEHELTWEEYNGPDEPPDFLAGWVSETTNLNGTAKLAFEQNKKVLSEVTYLSIDADRVEITVNPRR